MAKTCATMHVTQQTLDELTKRLTDAEYTHCIHDEGITLDGVMLVHDEEQARHEMICGLVLECVNNCKENGWWVHDGTNNLTDRELADDLYLKAGAFDRDDIDTEEIVAAIREMRSKF